jgi:hypothetical protein
MAEQEKDFQHEADFLAALLEHDDTPEDMRDYISNLVLELQGEVSLYTPAVLRVAWPLIRQQEHTSGDALWRAIVIALRAFADEETDHLLSEISNATRAAERQAKDRNSPAELAGHLAAVLAHPETPAALYNAIVNELGAWSSDYCNAVSDTVPYIESCLLHHQREQQEQTEGEI